jgi:anthranilate/para-aminobenzoate synthase component II
VSEQPADAGGPSGAKAVLIYNLLRLTLLAICLAVGYFAGLHGLYLIAAALLVSGVLSWFVLAKQRIRMGIAIERTVERGRSKMAERTAAEDEYADRVRAEAATPATSETAPSVNGTDK